MRPNRTANFICIYALTSLLTLDVIAQEEIAPPQTKSIDSTQSLATSVSALKEEFELRKIWFRYEPDNQDAIEVILGGGSSSDSLHIGSLSKSITAEAIAVLIQEKRLQLDSKLGDLLKDYFRQHGKSLDPSLENISVLQLLTHTAGLKANYSTDPVNGIDNSIAFRTLANNAAPIDYLFSANANVSSGGGKFSYSNISYLLLGLVVEAVSGLPYQEYCRQKLFIPLGVSSPKIVGLYNRLGPFAGWEMTMTDFLKLWKVFDRYKPSILSADTLQMTLLGQIGPAHGNNNVHYTLGAYVRQNADGSSYSFSHNGKTDFYKGEDQYYSFAESRIPGGRWFLETSPPPAKNEGREMSRAFREMVRNYEKSRH